jgi:hypothetical protein
MKRSKSAKRSRKAAKKKRTKPDDKEAATTFVPAANPTIAENAVPIEHPKTVPPAAATTIESPAPTTPETEPAALALDKSNPIVSSSRSEATRRTAQGKFTKAVFAQIGGAECLRFAAMTWKERDKYMAKPENSVVRERYKAHMASVGK